MAALATTPTKRDIYTEYSSSIRDKGSLFAFRNVNCVIPTPDGPRTVLESTTLLNALSQRMTFGTVTGEVLLDGSTPSKDFQRTTGFVEQQDLHEANQTVREALRFSARLRQTADMPLEEKYAYVEAIIKLLDVGPIADAIIDYVRSGLSVEERKRATIGIELASKPRILFLDEPTSGLEGAMSIVAFLRRLAQVENLSIICTINQSSSVLFNQFDNLLLRTDWGQRRDENLAEYLLEVVGAGIRRSKTDWLQVWLDSAQKLKLIKEISGMVEMSKITVGKRQRPGESQDHYTPLADFVENPSLGYALLFNSVLSAIICGVLFFQLKNSILDMQSRTSLMFFAATVIIPICEFD
ncbi:hypothetical protein V1506DRAFT_579090 [Lipomyces tetrasporus]